MPSWIGKSLAGGAEPVSSQAPPGADYQKTTTAQPKTTQISPEDCAKLCREQHTAGSPEWTACIEKCKGEAPAEEQVLACVDGKCVQRLKSNPGVTEEAIAACVGKAHGELCYPAGDCERECFEKYGKTDPIAFKECLKDCGINPPLPPTPPPNGDCPKGNWYTHFPADGPCHELYTFVKRGTKSWEGYEQGADGRCECTAWLKKWEKKQDGGDMGWFEFPEGFQEFYRRLMARGQDALDPSQYGFSQEMINQMFGKGFETIQARQPAVRESLTGILGREGMLGTGQAVKAMTGVGRESERNIANLRRDIFLESEKQKKLDYLNYSNLSRGIFGTGQNYNAMIEAINAGRRGERTSALQLLLDFFSRMGG